MIAIELFILALLAFSSAVFTLRRGSDCPVKPRASASAFVFAVVLLACGLNQYFSEGRLILAGGLLPPGSFLTRYVPFVLTPVLRRAIEPSYWLLLAAALSAAGSQLHRRVRIALLLGMLLLASVLFIESVACSVALAERLPNLGRYLRGSQVVLIHSALLLFAAGFVLSLTRAPAQMDCVVGATKVAAFGMLLLVGLPLSALAVHVASRSQSALLIGAHYYSWFPENWKGGDLGAKLSPQIYPKLGRYLSDGAGIFEQHVRWADQYGIDFLILDWWPQRSEIDRRLKKNIERTADFGKVRYAMLYESLDLKKRNDTPVPNEPRDVVYLSPQRIERFAKTVEYLATTYMTKAEYLTVGGKPVLFLYATRHLVGPVEDAVQTVRSRVRTAIGKELYIVGDEAFSTTLDFIPESGAVVLPECSPNWGRIRAFDALGVYNPYDSERGELGGTKGFSAWIEASQHLYACYQQHASTLSIPFLPTVLPGYNDRVTRPKQNHYVVPRFESGGVVSHFAKNLRSLVVPYLDDELRMFTVTSFNEWNEGTQIEPTEATEPTNLDQSETNSDFTAGEWYRGYEFLHLEELRDFRSELTPQSR